MYLDELINKNKKYLSENDYYIWDYISHNRMKCENISINDLADACNVSRTTILRFAKRIGLSGFSQFKVYLQLDNNSRTNESATVAKFVSCYSDYMSYLSDKDFTEISRRLALAKEIYACATGSIQVSVASELKRNFVRLSKFIYPIRLYEEVAVYEEIMTLDDIIFMISYSGSNAKMIEFAKKLKTKGVYQVAITGTTTNELSKICDESIAVTLPMADYGNGVFHEGMANYFILIDFLTIKYLDYLKAQEASHEHQ